MNRVMVWRRRCIAVAGGLAIVSFAFWIPLIFGLAPHENVSVELTVIDKLPWYVLTPGVAVLGMLVFLKLWNKEYGD